MITPSQLFKKPYLKKENKKEVEFITSFISEIKKGPILSPCYELNNVFHKIHTIREPASALTIMPDGNIISGYCRYDIEGNICGGEIVLRNPSGQRIKTLVKEPASALAILPDGNILSATRGFAKYVALTSKWIIRRGTIVLRKPSGQHIKTIVCEPASALATLPNGNILSATYHFGRGKIQFKEVKLIKRKIKAISMLRRINEVLIDNAALACIQFHKGNLLPPEISALIFSYVFPFPKMIIDKIINPDCCFHPTDAHIKKVSAANLFANRISDIRFFEQKPKNHDLESKQRKEIALEMRDVC